MKQKFSGVAVLTEDGHPVAWFPDDREAQAYMTLTHMDEGCNDFSREPLDLEVDGFEDDGPTTVTPQSPPTVERTAMPDPANTTQGSITPEQDASLREMLSTPPKDAETATELEWLTWFAQHADFGPADGDVRAEMKRQFRRETGKALPPGWNCEE